MKVLITGGAGYIGSVTASALEDAGHTPIILDSLEPGVRAFTAGRYFYEGDIADRALVRRVVEDHPDLDCTIHMAARVIVAESSRHPYLYYRENVAKSLELFDELTACQKGRIIFSSSASVYAPTPTYEVREDSPLGAGSAYARTKWAAELALHDMATATSLECIVFRYFNPVGADPFLRSGSHARRPTHALGRILESLSSDATFTVTGTGYPTRDGSGIRDYLDVWDLAQAHVLAIEQFGRVLDATDRPIVTMNLGTGSGVTVFELIQAVEQVVGHRLAVRRGSPREGDVVGAYANVDKVRAVLGWEAKRTLCESIQTALAWDRTRDHILGDA